MRPWLKGRNIISNALFLQYHKQRIMPNKRLLLLSSSNVHGYEYLQYAAKDIQDFLKKSNVTSVLFLPYAQPNYNVYQSLVCPVFRSLGFECESIHKINDPVQAIENAQAIFVGGGNTFLLLRSLYENRLMDVIRRRVLENGMPYIGASAGTNVATVNIATTNDMPIVHPPSYDALGLVPFNINPHFITEDQSCDNKHKGETREQRIMQYLELPGVPPVLAMREGCTLHVEGNLALLTGINNAMLFEQGFKARELQIGANLSELLKPATVCISTTV